MTTTNHASPGGEEAATVAYPRYIVIGYGETDHPQAAFVNERDQLLDAVLGMMYTSPSDADAEIREAYRKDLADDDEWSNEGIWSAEFEIGGITIYDLGEPVRQSASDKPIGEDAANGATGEPCIAPACHQWDGTNTCTCRAILIRTQKALPVLSAVLNTAGLAGASIADDLLVDVNAALAANGAMGEREAFDKALRETWQMVDPLNPPSAGTYYRGEHDGIIAALRTIRENFARAALTAEKVAAEPISDTCVNLFRPSTGDVFKALRTDSYGIRELLREGWQIAPQPAQPTQAAMLSDAQRKVIAALIDATRAAFHALDDSEEREGPNGRLYVIQSHDYDELSASLDALDELPDDKPRYTLGPAGKAEWALRALLAPSAVRAEQTDAVRDVLAERLRHVTVEGWTPEHDDKHTNGSLAVAGACYALVDARDTIGGAWPWDFRWWKPTTKRRNLIKAAALIISEIERVDRASKKAAS